MTTPGTLYGRSGDIHLAYQVIGDGPRDLIFVLDFASHLEVLWELLAPSMAKQPGISEWWGRAERYAASPGTALAKMRACLELDVRDVLPLVVAPTLVVQSRHNAYVRAGHGRYLAEHIRGARLLERESADHWPLPEPDLLGAIEEFVTGSRAQDDDADRFLATVLVVDVVGSTEHVTELGDRRWRVARDRFEQTVRRTLAVHITARVSSLADPGEVLVTRTVCDLVAGSGLAFADRGEHSKACPTAGRCTPRSGEARAGESPKPT